MLKKFKDFIARGNVLDMAVGVIVGGAFKEIVNSLVADIFTPVISLFTGGADFSSLHWVIKETAVLDEAGAPVLDEAGKAVIEQLTINYGAFIQNIIDFLRNSIKNLFSQEHSSSSNNLLFRYFNFTIF